MDITKEIPKGTLERRTMKEDDGNPSINYNIKKMWDYLCTNEEIMN
jgi:hypothetical protein